MSITTSGKTTICDQLSVPGIDALLREGGPSCDVPRLLNQGQIILDEYRKMSEIAYQGLLCPLARFHNPPSGRHPRE